MGWPLDEDVVVFGAIGHVVQCLHRVHIVKHLSAVVSPGCTGWMFRSIGSPKPKLPLSLKLRKGGNGGNHGEMGWAQP